MSDDKARVDAWMPMWIGDYLADTMTLTRDLHGGYLLMLFAYWRNRGPLLDDDDDMAAIVRCTADEWRERIRPKLSRFFAIEGGMWVHSRADRELASAGVRKEAATNKGKRGAQARWSKANKQCPSNATSNAQALPEQWPSPSPSPITYTEDFKGPQGASACEAGCSTLADPDPDDSPWGDDEPPPPPPPPAGGEDGQGLPEARATVYGLIAAELRRNGIEANPANIKFRALVDAGAEALEFLAYADRAKSEAKGAVFPYLLGIVSNERQRAKDLAAKLHHGPMPAAAPTPKEQRKTDEMRQWFGSAFQPNTDEDAHGTAPALR